MAKSVFELVAEGLEQRTQFQTLEARGTVRLALKEAGLDAASVTPSQMAVVLTHVLPGELRARGVAEPEKVCQELTASFVRAAGDLASADGPAARWESPEEIFRRLGR